MGRLTVPAAEPRRLEPTPEAPRRYRTARSSGLVALVLLVAGGWLGRAGPCRAAEDPSNTWSRAASVSRQFIGYAPSPLLAHALCLFGDRVRQEWRVRTGAPAAWRDPIILVVRPDEPGATNGPRLSLSIHPGDLVIRYEIGCRTPPSPDPGALATKVTEALCAELANRSRRPRAGELFEPTRLPWWLTTGLAQSIRGRDEELLELVRRSLAGGRPLSAAQVLALAQPPADADEERRQRAYCWLFVEALESQEDGSGRLARLLAVWRAAGDGHAALAEVYGFGFMAGPALERWWALQLAARTATVTAQNLALGTALDKLDELLPTRLAHPAVGAASETVVPLAELGRYVDAPWLASSLSQKTDGLLALREHAPPNARPVVAGYLEALQWLASGSVVRFERAVRRADQGRRQLRAFAGGLAAYLDQADRVHAAADLDQVFRDYFATFEQLEQVQQQRRSPISDYLDQFDK